MMIAEAFKISILVQVNNTSCYNRYNPRISKSYPTKSLFLFHHTVLCRSAGCGGSVPHGESRAQAPSTVCLCLPLGFQSSFHLPDRLAKKVKITWTFLWGRPGSGTYHFVYVLLARTQPEGLT